MPIGLKGNTDGSGAVQIGGSDAISISTGLNTTFAGTITATGTVAGTTGTLYPIVSGTAVASTSGTSIDFTGIPSWVKRVTVMFSGVSTNGTSAITVRIGDSGGIEATGYQGAVSAIAASVASGGTASSVGYSIGGASASNQAIGNIVLTNVTGNTWVGSWVMYFNDTQVNQGAGAKTLSDTLTQVRITTVNGTDTFDAGTINILYE